MQQVALLLLAALPALAIAHGGGLNAEGCHNNRKTGDYHCHRAPVLLPPPVSSARADATPARAILDHRDTAAPLQPAAVPLPSARPRCYVGPRGGTYTITASGRKNYGGC